VETSLDAMLLIESCRLRVLHPVSVRPRSLNSIHVRSGSIFVFEENMSKMRRWRVSILEFWDRVGATEELVSPLFVSIII
jgi:hypothetical protein